MSSVITDWKVVERWTCDQ